MYCLRLFIVDRTRSNLTQNLSLLCIQYARVIFFVYECAHTTEQIPPPPPPVQRLKVMVRDIDLYIKYRLTVWGTWFGKNGPRGPKYWGENFSVATGLILTGGKILSRHPFCSPPG